MKPINLGLKILFLCLFLFGGVATFSGLPAWAQQKVTWTIETGGALEKEKFQDVPTGAPIAFQCKEKGRGVITATREQPPYDTHGGFVICFDFDVGKIRPTLRVSAGIPQPDSMAPFMIAISNVPAEGGGQCIAQGTGGIAFHTASGSSTTLFSIPEHLNEFTSTVLFTCTQTGRHKITVNCAFGEGTSASAATPSIRCA